jgi:hypothetical protein
MYLVSDNGPQFTSEEFKVFMESNGIFHKRGAPYHPATNGQAERGIQTIKQKLKSLKWNNLNELEKNVRIILMQYRITKHAITDKSPSEIVFGRNIRSKLDLIMPCEDSHIEIECLDTKNIRSLGLNERVSARNYSRRGEKWKFGHILKKLGKLHYLIKMDDGNIWKRHIDQIRTIGKSCKSNEDCENGTKLVHTRLTDNNDNEVQVDDHDDVDHTSNSDNSFESCNSEQSTPQNPSPQLRRPVRNRQRPIRFNDYDLSTE